MSVVIEKTLQIKLCSITMHLVKISEIKVEKHIKAQNAYVQNKSRRIY